MRSDDCADMYASPDITNTTGSLTHSNPITAGITNAVIASYTFCAVFLKFFIFFKEAKISLFKFVYINSNHHQIQS